MGVKAMSDEMSQLKKVKSMIDGIGINYREELDNQLVEINVAKKLIHKMDIFEICNTIRDYPLEDKDDMSALMTAFYFIKKANGDLDKADSLLDDYINITKAFYLNKIDIYDLYSNQLQIEEEINDL